MILQKQDRLIHLLNSKRINPFEYDSYLMFELSDLGRNYLKNALDSVVLEEPMQCKKDNVMYIDGRRSVWREIKIAINRINSLLEGEQYERPEFPDLEYLGK